MYYREWSIVTGQAKIRLPKPKLAALGKPAFG